MDCDFYCFYRVISDGTTDGHGPGPDAKVATSADREKSQRPDRFGAHVVRGPPLLRRPAFENCKR